MKILVRLSKLGCLRSLLWSKVTWLRSSQFFCVPRSLGKLQVMVTLLSPCFVEATLNTSLIRPPSQLQDHPSKVQLGCLNKTLIKKGETVAPTAIFLAAEDQQHVASQLATRRLRGCCSIGPKLLTNSSGNSFCKNKSFIAQTEKYNWCFWT